MKTNPLRSLGDLQQYMSAETRVELDAGAGAGAPAPEEPDTRPLVATLVITYNISVTRLMQAFLTDNVLRHYILTPPGNTGTLGSFELGFRDVDTMTDVIAMVDASTIPTVKRFAALTPLVRPVAGDGVLEGTAVEGDADALNADMNVDTSELGSDATEETTPNHITPEDLAEADTIAAAEDAANAVRDEPDTYMGRRVLEAKTPDAAPALHPDLPTSIVHMATAQVFATYPNLAQAQHAYDTSTSPRKHEFDLVQQVALDTPQDFDTDDAPVASADDLAAGPYTLQLLDGVRWDTIETFPSTVAAHEWLWSNVRSEDFNPAEWALCDYDGNESDLSAVFTTPTVSAPAEPAPSVDTVEDVVPVEPVTVAPLTDRTNRVAVIDHITSFFGLLKLPLREDLHQMSDDGLFDLLRLLEANNGGSIEAAAIIASVEDAYQRFMASPMLAMKMRGLDTMGATYFSSIQRIQDVLGGDAVIAGMKGAAYHDQLKYLVQHVSVLNDAVMDLGALLGVDIRVDGLTTLTTVPAVEGLPFNPKLCMYVLEIFRSHVQGLHTTRKTMAEDLKRATATTADAVATATRIRTEAHAAIESFRNREAQYLAQLADNSETYWVLRTPSGKYLAKIDPDAPAASATDLTIVDDHNGAIRFPSRSRAMAVRDRLVATRRFRKVTLKLHRASLMAEE